MSHLLFLIFYLIFLSIILCHEVIVFRRSGIDSVSIVVFFLVFYTLIPPVIIHGTIIFTDEPLYTNVNFFNRALDTIKNNHLINFAIIILNAVFTLFFYAFAGSRGIDGSHHAYRKMSLNVRRSFLIIVFSLIICLSFFWDLGSNLLERYSNLILFRAGESDLEWSYFRGNVFGLTQAFVWLSAIFLYCHWTDGRRWSVLFTFISMIVFAILMGSRRAFLFPIILIYFSYLMAYKKFHIKKMVITLIGATFFIAYGKAITGLNARNQELIVGLGELYSSNLQMIISVACDIGISHIQSILVLRELDHFVYPRFGVDHLLSILTKIPEASLGFEVDWPERIVRVSTRVFETSTHADIPPGLIGQSWLDFPGIGALCWGALIGLQARVVNFWAKKIINTKYKFALISLFSVIVAMPINTGSYDFIFSVDIFFIVATILLVTDKKTLVRNEQETLKSNLLNSPTR